MFIEVDVTAELKSSISIRDSNGNKLNQEVEYELRPTYYKICIKMGHKCKEKRQQVNKDQEKKMWITKPNKKTDYIAKKKDYRARNKAA